MAAQATCPNPARLQELIDGSLPEPEQSELTAHLDSCECCQAKMDVIADGGATAVACLKGLGGDRPADDSAFWPAVRKLEADATWPASRADSLPDIRLDFLEP